MMTRVVPGSTVRSFPLLATLVMLMIVSVFWPISPARADNFSNAAIADKALSYVGKWGGEACGDAGKLDGSRTVGGYGAGQCRTFVNCIVLMVTGKYLPNYSSDYFGSFINAGAQEIKQIDDLAKGDIVQNGQGGHTFIIVNRVSGTNFNVVDSNWGNDEAVQNHSMAVTLDSNRRAFRMSSNLGEANNLPSTTFSPGSPPEGVVIENGESPGRDHYVLSGGSAFWFDKTDASQEADFENQMRAKLGVGQSIFMMHAADIKAIEGSPWASPRRKPNDGTFMYERGNGTQYMMLFGQAWPIGGYDELNYLTGVDKAIMVPAGSIGSFLSGESIPNGRLLRANAPLVVQVWTGAKENVNNLAQLDCLMAVNQTGVTAVPQSLMNALPQDPDAKCILPPGSVFYDTTDGHQDEGLYGGAFLVTYSELFSLNLAGRALPMAHDGMLYVESQMQFFGLPNGHQFQAPGHAEIDQSWGNRLEHITSSAQLQGLQALNHVGVEMVPQSFVDATPKGPDAILSLPDGMVVYDDQTGTQYLSMFGGLFQLSYGELDPLGLVGRATSFPHAAVQLLLGQNQYIGISANLLLQAPGSATVYESLPDGTIQGIADPVTLECFKTRDGQPGPRLVPQDLFSRMVALGRVKPGASPCSLENSLLLASNGVSVGYVLNGQLHGVSSPAIRDCLIAHGARVSGTGGALPTSDYLWNSYPVGSYALCA